MDYSKFHEALGCFREEPVSTGTTLIAMQYDGGVIIGTDSRTSAGSYIVSRVTNKITPITDNIYACRAGSAADTQAIAEIVKYFCEAYSTMEGEPITVYRAAQIFRKYLFNYRDQLTASLIIVGHDNTKGGQIYSIPLGGLITRQYFTASGSGSSYITTILDKNWKPNMTRDEVFDLVRTAASLAIYRDGSSGGIIRMCDINSTGSSISVIRPDEEFPSVPQPPSYTDELSRLSLAESKS